MKQSKKQVTWLAVLFVAAVLVLSGCGRGMGEKPTPTPTVTATPALQEENKGSAAFDQFVEDFFKYEVVSNTINLHYTLAYPENFGITDYEISLGDGSYEGLVASYDELRQIKAAFEELNDDKLSKEQKFTYDILMDYIDTELSTEDLILYAEYFGPTTGYQAQLPVLLAEYTFRREQDIEDYLDLLCVVDDTFAGMVVFEQKKSEAGLFMSDTTLESILDQCIKMICYQFI